MWALLTCLLFIDLQVYDCYFLFLFCYFWTVFNSFGSLRWNLLLVFFPQIFQSCFNFSEIKLFHIVSSFSVLSLCWCVWGVTGFALPDAGVPATFSWLSLFPFLVITYRVIPMLPLSRFKIKERRIAPWLAAIFKGSKWAEQKKQLDGKPSVGWIRVLDCDKPVKAFTVACV